MNSNSYKERFKNNWLFEMALKTMATVIHEYRPTTF